MPGKGLLEKVVATAIAAACVFVAVVALGATLFYLLLMVVPAAAAAAITAAVAAVGALIIAMMFLNRAKGDEDEEEPAGLGERAFVLFRNRPVLATVAALAGGWIFLRNPALASMVAAAFTESSRGRRR
jgi:hypothetical protein